MDSFQGVLRIMPDNGTVLDYTTSISETEIRTVGDNMGCPSALGISSRGVEVTGTLRSRGNAFLFGEETDARVEGNGTAVTLTSRNNGTEAVLTVKGGNTMNFKTTDGGNLMTVGGSENAFSVVSPKVSLNGALRVDGNVVYVGSQRSIDAPYNSCFVADFPVVCRSSFESNGRTAFKDTLVLRPASGTVPSSLNATAVNASLEGEQLKAHYTKSIEASSEQVVRLSSGTSILSLSAGSVAIESLNGMVLDTWKLRTKVEATKGTVLGCTEYGYIQPVTLSALDLTHVASAEIITPFGSTDKSF